MRTTAILMSMVWSIRVESEQEAVAIMVTHSGMAIPTEDGSSGEGEGEEGSDTPCINDGKCGGTKLFSLGNCNLQLVKKMCPAMCGECTPSGAVGGMGSSGYMTTRAPVTLR
mmetsp:Transcript_9661/g.23056  ORF Transcript_9661/g.23056 Transcript_9661/m.23056 type:complete len:112 (+) Transcript_9661:96-431(+)